MSEEMKTVEYYTSQIADGNELIDSLFKDIAKSKMLAKNKDLLDAVIKITEGVLSKIKEHTNSLEKLYNIKSIEDINKEDPLINLESAKKLTETELKEYQFNSRSVKVDMKDIKEGDYISYGGNEGRVNKKTPKCLFISIAMKQDIVKETYSNYSMQHSYYMFVDINSDIEVLPDKKKVLIKDVKVNKATHNFIQIDMTDLGN